MTRALIADDEAHLAQYLKDQLLRLWPELEIVQIARNGDEAAALIAQLEPDIAFLDIQMPGLNGLEVAQGIEGATRVVFVTAYDEFALQAFEHAALDYLLKPLKSERLARTIERVKAALAAPPPEDARMAQALQQLMAGSAATPARLRYVRATRADLTHQIDVDQVLFFHADDKYTVVQTASGEYLIRMPIAELAAQLDPSQFCQIHRSTLINLAHLGATRRNEPPVRAHQGPCGRAARQPRLRPPVPPDVARARQSSAPASIRRTARVRRLRRWHSLPCRALALSRTGQTRMFRLSLKMTMRDWRAGELHFLLAALALAVAAIASVNFFTDRLGTAISRNAHHMLGADLLLSSGKPLAPSWQDTARKAGLASAQTVILSSMASNGAPGAPMQLVELKAVGPGYPLRGALRLAGGAASAHGGAAPAPGTAWIDPALMAQLHLAPGQAIKVGDLRMRVADVIVSEPDRGLSPILLPRVMIALTDLAASGLLQDGARAHYQLLLAGEAPALSATAAAFKASLAQSRRKDVRMASIESMQSDMGGALTQAGQFFSLVSLLTAMLAALAVAMAARRFMLRHADACAVLRCLGLRQAQLARLFLYEFLLVGAAATGVGLLCGYAGHFVLLECMAGVLRMEMPPPSALPALFSGATGLLMLLGFALPPLLQLRDVAPIRVLRREHGAPPARAAFTYLPGALAFGALVLWQCGDAKLGLFTFAGFGAAAIIFAAAAALGLLALVPARAARLGPAWRFALTSLQRRRRATITQTAALALGLMALLLLSVVRTDLTAAWREAIPANAPTHWIMNIQSAQHDEVAARLRVFGEPTMYPDVRARLVLINGKPLSAFTFARGIATDIAERELDMTASAKPPPSSSISGGQWFKADAATPEVSIDAEVLAELKLALGDTLAFDVGARRINARITSTRKIDRRSRSSDFLFVVNPQAVAGLLQNWSAAVKVPASDTAFAGRMGEHFPNLSIFHIGTLLAQMQQLLAQVATAIEFLFLFTLAAGVLVLYAALASSQDERMRQSAILRALGASRRQLVRAQWIEFLLTGAMAGALAAAGACLASWALARFVFDLPWTMAPALLPLGVLAGCLCAVAGAWSGLRHVLNTPPLNSLRAA